MNNTFPVEPPPWWPIVWWFHQAEGGWFIYRPSWYHHGGHEHRPLGTYVAAMVAAIQLAGRFHARPGYLPTLLPGALRQHAPPDYDPASSSLELRLPETPNLYQ